MISTEGHRRVRLRGNLYHVEVPEGAVSIARPSRWGNPFKIGEHGRDEALRLYRRYLAGHPEVIAAARRYLAGRDLACWCPPDEDCHGDILLAIVNGEAP